MSYASLFHIFLVEDNAGLNRDLKALLEAEVPRTHVISALCVSEAFTKLADPQLPRLDLAILDLRLPEVPGAVKKIHPELAKKISDLRVPSILMSGYLGSEDVDSFICDRKLHDPPLKVISKRGMDTFFDELRDTIRDYFVSTTSEAVDKHLDRVFGNGHSLTEPRSSGTAELLSLQRQIANYYDYLSDAAKTAVACWFTVTDDENGERRIRLRMTKG